jgi:hypothetical protein
MDAMLVPVVCRERLATLTAILDVPFDTVSALM